MTDQDQEFTKALVEKALRDEHMPWQFIHNLQELTAARFIIKANSGVVKGFKKSYDQCMHDYITSLKADESRLDVLISAKQMKKCLDFYKKEVSIAKDMIKEFKCYLRWGHFTKMILLNSYRPEEDETDWRKLPITWNIFKK